MFIYDFNYFNYYLESVSCPHTHLSHVHSHCYRQQSYWILAFCARYLILINYLTFCNACNRFCSLLKLF